MRIISLGWGVQSFALAAMSAFGVLPPINVAVHADTGHERAETYAFAAKWTPWLEERGMRVITIRGGHRVIGLGNEGESEISIPAFTTRTDGQSSGMLRRQCTKEWKISPIRRWLQAHRNKQSVEQWLGITLDEAKRTKPSGVKYIRNIYPLIENLGFTRADVIRWLQDNDLEIPVKSSCIFCPYHDRQTWRDIQLTDNEDWEKALEVDQAIRHKRPGYLCYLTAQRKPLIECDFRSQEEHGQLGLWETQ